LPTEAILAHEDNLTVVGTAEDMPLSCDSGVVVTLNTLGERPEEVRAVIRAVRQAVQFMQADRAESVRQLAEWQQVEERQAGLAFDLAQVQVSFSLDKATGQRAVEGALAYSKEAGEVEPGIQLADVADLSLAP
jgi:ABC-type nitrate/sulfonate/bicarbonate transport system substrate-binding protein